MKKIVTVLAILAILAMGLPAVSMAGDKTNPLPEDFVGDWRGYWDGSDSIRLLIRPNPDQAAPGTMLVQLTWGGNKEDVVGRLQGNKLLIGRRISLTIDEKKADKAHAKYAWEGEYRSATMKK